MWDKSKTSVPIEQEKEKQKITHHQDFSDGILEFLSFTDTVKFSVLERLFTGGGLRIAQGKFLFSNI